MISPKIILTACLAIFTMFFGSGNLVFPLKIGAISGADYKVVLIGFLITGIIVPFIGLFSMTIYEGRRKEYFGLLGPWAPFVLSLIMLSLLGPFGVIPRCIIVAYGGINLLYPDIPFSIFSLIFLLLVIIIIWERDKLVPIIGKFFGPFKIGAILLIIAAALIKAPELNENIHYKNSLSLGLYEGYQTMDLLAAFFFSIPIIEYIRQHSSTTKEIIKTSVISGFIGVSLIAIIYIGLIKMGAYYSSDLVNVKPEQYLSFITQITLGKSATLLVTLTMLIACLTTAASLSRLFAEFLQKDISGNKFSWPLSMIITLVISYILSLTGFSKLSAIIGYVLEYIYPALIVFSILSIVNKYVQIRMIKESFWMSIILTSCYKFMM